MNKKKLPIGLSNFEELISENYYFVDKSLFIKELLDGGAKVTLIPRPRRFGKTLNMTMLKIFFEKPLEINLNKKFLFKDLKISQYPECLVHQEKYPVIFLTFKAAKQQDWVKCYGQIKEIIAGEFLRHDYLIKNKFLNEIQEKKYKAILDGTAEEIFYQNSIKDLSGYLHKYYNEPPIILIDEYDVPIQAGFLNNFYNPVINFTRNLLCSCLKDNSNLNFAILTGILRVAKESIFSGLNNLEVCSLLNNNYSDKFGLLEQEVKELFNYYNLDNKLEEVKAWYNGYSIGDSFTVYNPWSIINLVKNNCMLQPYWINTSDNLIIKNLIEQGSQDLKLDIEDLLAGNNIEKYINENIILDTAFQSEAVWSFLLFSGYLSFDKIYLKEEFVTASLRIPNLEVKYFYKTVILNWLSSSISMKKYLEMLKTLLQGDINSFKEIFYDFVLKSFSCFDVSGDEPEKFYHAFVLGMFVSLTDSYEIKSNKESGFGRYDLMIIPKDINKLGIIIEFKKVSLYEKETLEQAADNALKQIEKKAYQAELNARGINNILKLGIAFEGKKALIKN